MMAAALYCRTLFTIRNYKTGNFTEMPTNMIGHSSQYCSIHQKYHPIFRLVVGLPENNTAY